MSWRRLAAYGAIYFFWGASFLAIREIVAVAPPFLSAGFRFTVAGLALYIWSRFRGAPRPTRRQFKWSAILGLLMFAINYACLFWSEQRVASGYAAIIAATIPMWIFLGEWLVLHAMKPGPMAIAGILCGMAGVALVVLPGAALPGSPGGAIDRASFALLAGALCWSTGTIWSRKVDIPRSPVESASLQMGCGGVMLLAFSAAAGEFAHIGELSARWNWRLTLDMAYLICCASIAAFTAFLYLMNREPATRVASSSYVNPLVAVVMGALFAGERLAPVQLAGAALVISGVFFTLRGKKALHRTPVRAPDTALRS